MMPDHRAYIESWLTKAEHDLMSAKRLIEIEPMILDTACFHCQQTIEKSLKAFLHYNNKEVERTHNIRFLLEECSAFDSSFSGIEPLNINLYAVQIRYPDMSLQPEKAEAEYFYKLAAEVLSVVKEKIVFPE